MDAFSDGVKPGGLFSSQDIKILICYMLLGVDRPMPRQAVVEILSGGEMANLFETSAAIDDLTARGHLTEDADGLLTLTETGRQVAQTLSTMVPYTLRERSLKAALRLLTRHRREQETAVTVDKLDRGYAVTCAVDTSEHPMMSVTLRVADEMQVSLIREHFLDDPVTVYRSVIALLTGDARVEKNGRQITINMP